MLPSLGKQEVSSISKKLDFEDDSPCSTSVSDVVQTNFANFFLKKERKHQSDSIIMQSQTRTFETPELKNPSSTSTPPRNISANSLAKLLGLKTAPSTSSEIESDQPVQAKTILFKDLAEKKPCLNTKNDVINTVTKPPSNLSLHKFKQNFSGYSKNIESIKEDEHDFAEDHGMTRSRSNQLSVSTNRSLKSPELPIISCQATAQLIAESHYSDFLIIDCRYDYEFRGGHINEALNILSPEILEQIFFTNKHLLYNPEYIQDLKKDLEGTLAKAEAYKDAPAESLKKRLPKIIFHCEFSQKRGPRAFRLLRSRDREINFKNFPHIDYAEIYLLEGGYCNFYPQYPELCEGGYLRMVDKSFKSQYSQSRDCEKKVWEKKCHGTHFE